MVTHYNKLIRDRIPEIVRGGGGTAVVTVLSDAAYREALDRKLSEELAEYLAEGDVAELADLLEVVLAICETRGVDADALEAMRRAKAEKNGRFSQRLFLVSVERA